MQTSVSWWLQWDTDESPVLLEGRGDFMPPKPSLKKWGGQERNYKEFPWSSFLWKFLKPKNREQTKEMKEQNCLAGEGRRKCVCLSIGEFTIAKRYILKPRWGYLRPLTGTGTLWTGLKSLEDQVNWSETRLGWKLMALLIYRLKVARKPSASDRCNAFENKVGILPSAAAGNAACGPSDMLSFADRTSFLGSEKFPYSADAQKTGARHSQRVEGIESDREPFPSKHCLRRARKGDWKRHQILWLHSLQSDLPWTGIWNIDEYISNLHPIVSGERQCGSPIFKALWTALGVPRRHLAKAPVWGAAIQIFSKESFRIFILNHRHVSLNRVLFSVWTTTWVCNYRSTDEQNKT